MSKRKTETIDWEKNINYAAMAVIAVLCVIYIGRTNGIIHYTGGDDANYILLAKAMVAGDGYRDSFKVGQPANVHFPPMFPLILAGVISIFGTNSLIMKLVVSFAAAASFILSFMLAKRRKFAWPFVAAIWFGFCYRYFSYTDLLLSEALFTAFTLGGMLALDKWLENNQIKYAIIAVACCWISEMTRTAGITIPIAFGGAIFLKKGRSINAALLAIAAVAVLILPVVLWSIRNKMVADVSSSYVLQFLAADPYDPTKGILTPLGLIKRFLFGLKYYFIDISGIIRPLDEVTPGAFNILLSSILLILTMVGFIRKAIEDIGVTEIFAVAFAGMVIIWPFFEFYRFLLPAYPLIFMYAAHGAHYFIGIASTKKTISYKPYFIAFLSAIFIIVTVLNSIEMIKYEKFVSAIKYRAVRIAPGIYGFAGNAAFDQLLKAALWLSANAQKNAVIVTRKPSLVALTGATPVIDVPIPPPADAWKWVKEHQVRYILMDQIALDVKRFMQALSNGQGEVSGVRVVYNSDNTFVFEINPELLK